MIFKIILLLFIFLIGLDISDIKKALQERNEIEKQKMSGIKKL